VTTAGDVTTIGGGSGVARILDGLGTQAQFQDTDAVAVDSAGVIYVGDTGVIRRGHPSFVQSPSIVAHPSPQSKVIGAAATFSVHAIGIPEPALQWEISTNGGIDWSQVIDGGVFKGASTSTLTITAVAGGMSGSLLRCVASNATGAAASAPALLTVFDVVTSPAMLMFGGTKDQAGNLVHVTPPQTVTVKFGADVPAAAWQAFSDQPWLQLTHAAGTGTAQLQASIANPGLFPDLLTRLSANVTIAIAGFAPVTMPVTLFVSGSSSVPYGQIDAPLPNTTGISGALAVSGWALDDIGVQSVKIYRNCLAEEPQSHCGPPSGFPGSAKYVYLGEAAFLEDARPDIAEQFSYSPASHRGGWGFQLLTNMLPRTEGPYQPYGGQGPITLYAIATDVEGHVTFLARDWTDTDPVQTSAPITLDNDHLARPFGTIDTPSQGESIVETLLANFGWALTPDSNAGYSIPTDGSTMFVFVDGVPIGNVTYSQCRGDVGNPPPAGVFCNDDVANVFGNVAPQPPLTPRTSNPSPFLNLDAGRGAIGSFLLDLSSYEPGLHTIAWSVTDSAGRVEGIGSRFFRYWPSAPRPAATRAPSSKTSPQRTLRTGAKWLADGVSDRRDGRVLVRTGFDLNQRYTAVPPLAAERAVTIPQLGRVEAHLGAGATVTMPLPIGARLDRETGVFTWVPPVGYLGPYAITFARPDGPFVLNVTIGR